MQIILNEIGSRPTTLFDESEIAFSSTFFLRKIFEERGHFSKTYSKELMFEVISSTFLSKLDDDHRSIFYNIIRGREENIDSFLDEEGFFLVEETFPKTFKNFEEIYREITMDLISSWQEFTEEDLKPSAFPEPRFMLSQSYNYILYRNPLYISLIYAYALEDKR